jgi:hypothetical protein
MIQVVVMKCLIALQSTMKHIKAVILTPEDIYKVVAYYCYVKNALNSLCAGFL